MGKRISKEVAHRRLEEAVDWARSDRFTPDRWRALTWRMNEAPSITYTPALGTALLAKAVDPTVDALAIKASHSPDAYSQRTLCHTVLVPAAAKYGFTLRATGREPLNNQPFFRYDHIALIERSKGGLFLDELRDALREFNESTASEALAALAAFLRVRFEVARSLTRLELPDVGVPVDRLIELLERFLADEFDRPKRTQALVCAAFDTIFDEIHTRRINDPSRDFPGDVQALSNRRVIMSAEARGKPVLTTEIRSYADALRRKDISRGFVVVLHPAHQPLPRAELIQWAWSNHQIFLTIIESVTELVYAVCAWSTMPLDELLQAFPQRLAVRLDQIEVEPASQERWSALVGSSRHLSVKNANRETSPG